MVSLTLCRFLDHPVYCKAVLERINDGDDDEVVAAVTVQCLVNSVVRLFTLF